MYKSVIVLLHITLIVAHDGNNNRAIEFPDLAGYKTLVCDLHMHTVFSDGSVWPNIRVMEAQKDGLDVIATTEHLEYQSWIKDIPHPDRNRSFELATGFAKNSELMVDDPIDAYREARKQDAFIFWNHPYWASQSPDASVPLDQLHLELIQDGLLEGIEVVNDTTLFE